ncbi:hypothetical protein B0H13DRAFT_2304191 [Mycena leptocephala]|nr:hypothetical protein B0H13DRAFT_2304191 [Mycena leptocephala]
MKSQTSSLDSTLVNSDVAASHQKSQTRKIPSEARKLSQREASAKYRWKNEEELREKARIRMANRCLKVKQEEFVDEDLAARTKLAHANYRKKHAGLLAFKQRVRRQEAFIAKHGLRAHQDRIAKQRAAEDAAFYQRAQRARETEDVRRALHHSRGSQ